MSRDWPNEHPGRCCRWCLRRLLLKRSCRRRHCQHRRDLRSDRRMSEAPTATGLEKIQNSSNDCPFGENKAFSKLLQAKRVTSAAFVHFCCDKFAHKIIAACQRPDCETANRIPI